MDFCGSPFCDCASELVREKRNVAAQMPGSNPEVRGHARMQMLTEQLFNECLISARHGC